VTSANAWATELLHALLTLPARLGALADETGTPPVSTLGDVVRLVEHACAVNNVYSRGLGGAFSPERTVEELRSWALSLASRQTRREAGLTLGFWERRKLAGRARTAFSAVADDSELSEGLLQACAVRSDLLDMDAAIPVAPFASARDARPAWEAVKAAVGNVQPYVRGLELPEARTLEGVTQFVEMLLADDAHWQYPQVNDNHIQLIEAGCEPVVHDLFEFRPSDPAQAADRLTQAFAMTVIEHIERTDQRLMGMTTKVRDRAVERFSRADAHARDANRQRIARAAAERLGSCLDAHPEQAELLTAQLKRKRGFLPIRELVKQAPDVLLAAKPVWVASPQIASERLPRQQIFDVVVFDEASQIQPAAALPSIARGAQLVVAGDSLQLPPTTLFKKTLDGQAGLPDGTNTKDEEEDSNAVETGLVIQDMESILDAVETKLGRQRSRHLAWHYRSRDERLIATSNRWVYEPVGRHLTTFPAADGATSLMHVVVPWSPGLGRNNLSPHGEVSKVIDLVLQHVADHPGESLGVIAFGQKHAERLEDELERRLRDEPDHVREWFDPDRVEAFFVKNIERVQGDERSKIILTVGYAKSDDQRLRYNWGPVLQSGGQRRVNVAISRARRDLILVTSFAAADVDERASEAEGFQLMRRFITFASTNGQTFGDEGERDFPLNPFEYDIHQRLLAAGLDVTPQYGVGRYRLDFAVRHPEKPGEFVLAIEADGASYHSGTIARERDRLRRQVLEDKGWRFVRIWSTDYFRNPGAQIRRVLDAYEAARRGAQDSSQASPVASSKPVPRPVRARRPPVRPGQPMGAYSDNDLDAMVQWVTSDDLVHTNDEVFEMVKRELGFQRNGPRIVARIRDAVERAK